MRERQPPVTRREALAALSTAVGASVAGCTGGEETGSPTPSPTPTASPTATPDRPNVKRQVILRDRAAITHIQRLVTGEIVWPSFDVVDPVDPALLGAWQSGDDVLAFSDDASFTQTGPDYEYGGSWVTYDGTLYLDYENDDTFQYGYSVDSDSSGVAVTFSTDSDSFTYERTRDGRDGRSIVERSDDLFLVEHDDPDEKGGDIQGGNFGSGFVVSPDGYVATNAHVVGVHREPAATLYRRLANLQRLALQETLAEEDLTDSERDQVADTLLDTFLSYYGEHAETRDVSQEISVLYGRATPGEDVSVASWTASIETAGSVVEEVGGEPSWGRDVAILKVDAGHPLPTVPLGDATDLGTGEEVFVIGYPELGVSELFEDRDTTLEPTLTAGVVSARRTLNSGVETIQTDAAINNGNSGGPVYDSNGEVVGIATFSPTDLDIQDIQFALPIEIVEGFMAELGVENTPGELTTTFRQGLNAYWRGDCETVTERMESVMEMWPDHPYAQEFVDDC